MADLPVHVQDHLQLHGPTRATCWHSSEWGNAQTGVGASTWPQAQASNAKCVRIVATESLSVMAHTPADKPLERFTVSLWLRQRGMQLRVVLGPEVNPNIMFHMCSYRTRGRAWAGYGIFPKSLFCMLVLD